MKIHVLNEKDLVVQKAIEGTRRFAGKEDAIKKSIGNARYAVMCEEGTEPAFQNEYYNNHEPGLYVDPIDGTPLFSSQDKYDSGTGWPSFTKPLDQKNVELLGDESLGLKRVEVRSVTSKGHLGHVFEDGPAPTGLRYCMNSASLHFIPLSKLEAEGYGEYIKRFK